MSVKSETDDIGMGVTMNFEEERIIADYLQNDLNCHGEIFYLLMEESKRLFKIIFRHDSNNKKSAGVSRHKIIESIKFTIKNIIDNEVDNYAWIVNHKLNERSRTDKNIS